MNERFTIELSRARFSGMHGLYPEEALTGNEFEITIAASYIPLAPVSDLDGVPDYGRLFELTREEMKRPTSLLETLAIRIAERIHADYPIVTFIRISITKCHPPIPACSGVATVTYERQY